MNPEKELYSYVIKDATVKTVIEAYLKRSNVGLEKYGTSLSKNDLPLLEWLKHSQMELMDCVLYLQRAIDELEDLTNV